MEGRITLEELEERLDGVMAARTIRELAELVYDLPASAAPAEQPEPGLEVRVGPPGRLPFTRLSLEERAPRRTDLTAHGTAPRRVRKAFAQLTFH